MWKRLVVLSSCPKLITVLPLGIQSDAKKVNAKIIS